MQNQIEVYPYFVKRSMRNMNYREAKSSNRKLCPHCAEYLTKCTYFSHRRKYCDRISGKCQVSTKNYHLDTERDHETNPESKPRQGETLPGTSQKKSKKTSKGITDTYSGRKVSARTERNIDAVRNSVGHSPKKSLRRRSRELGISRESLRRVLKAGVHLYPYQIQIKQKLTEADMAKRVTMCEWFCDTIEDNPDFLDHVWFSDEAHFLLSGHVNSKNNVYWGTEPPEEVLQRPLHSIKCTAWVAISKHGIIGPYWFEDENERAQTVNTERYVAVLRKFWTSLG